MVAATYEQAMGYVYVDEGGFTNDRLDPGQATNLGITIFDARLYAKEFGWIVDREVTVADMKVLPKWFADKVYKAKYADKVAYDQLPAGFDYSVLDAGINSGIGRAIPWAGKALRVDHPVSHATEVVAYASTFNDKVAAIQNYWAVRLSFLHGLRTWSHFGPGWGKRCARGEANAVKMWHVIGEGKTADQTKADMTAHSNKAKDAAKKSATVAAGTGAGTGAATSAPHPALDFTHLGLGGKVLLALFIALLIAGFIIAVRETVIHAQRASAYANA
jgi:lysozyme family protein